jgi:hypothetical protein
MIRSLRLLLLFGASALLASCEIHYTTVYEALDASQLASIGLKLSVNGGSGPVVITVRRSPDFAALKPLKIHIRCSAARIVVEHRREIVPAVLPGDNGT